jgi:hypothetical protein
MHVGNIEGGGRSIVYCRGKETLECMARGAKLLPGARGTTSYNISPTAPIPAFNSF